MHNDVKVVIDINAQNISLYTC